jgi:signal transduction histidine kinase
MGGAERARRRHLSHDATKRSHRARSLTAGRRQVDPLAAGCSRCRAKTTPEQNHQTSRPRLPFLNQRSLREKCGVIHEYDYPHLEDWVAIRAKTFTSGRSKKGSPSRKTMPLSPSTRWNYDDGILARASVRPRELHLCIALIGISAIVFLACLPYIRVLLPASPAFVAAYNAVSTLNDLTTSVILFSQFSVLRSRALLLLAGGYLFAAVISVVQLLTFPDAFTTGPLLGAGPQTALWLCIFWHGGFPIALIFYALTQGDSRQISTAPYIAIVWAGTAVIGVVVACWWAATWGAENARLLPSLLDANGFTFSQRIINLIDIILAVAAFALLAARSRHNLLNLWLTVVMGYWLCDVILSSYLNSTRYDFGFYAGRIYGALAASFLLAVLVLENSLLYRRLANAASRLTERASELSHANEMLRTEIESRQKTEEELRRAQAELDRVSRMTAMDELTSSLADEVNHPIGAMMINAETCLRWLSEDAPNVENARQTASMIVRDGTRASETVARMQQRFDMGAPLRESVDVNELIREMIALLRDEAARNGVSIRTDLAESVSRVAGDRIQLKQVLMNLMVNGMEAMRDGDGARELIISSRQVERDKVTVSVSDTGVGLPALPGNQIFKAFFSTKPHSLGMGLSISRSIIKDHGGRLWATNNPARGANFNLTLPIES